MKTFVDFNDTSIPLYDRMMHYMDWLVYDKGHQPKEAASLTAKKFYSEIQEAAQETAPKGDEYSLEFLKSLPVSDLYVVKEVKI